MAKKDRIKVSQLPEATDTTDFYIFGSKTIGGAVKSVKFLFNNITSLFGVSQEKGQDIVLAPSLKLFTDEVNMRVVNAISSYPFTSDAAREYPDVTSVVLDLKFSSGDPDGVYLSDIGIQGGNITILHFKKGSDTIAHVFVTVPIKTIGNITYFNVEPYNNSGYSGVVGLNISINIDKITIQSDILPEAFSTSYKTKYDLSLLDEEFINVDNKIKLKADENLLPGVVNDSKTYEYNLPDIDSLSQSGGDFDAVWYSNQQSIITARGALKEVTVKTTADGIMSLMAFIGDTSGIEVLHTYDSINVSEGKNTYTIADDFVLPIGSRIAITFDTNIGFYDDVPGFTSLRINKDNLITIESSANVAYNFKTTGATTAKDILSKKVADTLYIPLSSYSLLNPYKKQTRIVLSPDDTITLLGDSNSSDDYPWYKEGLQNFTGATVLNKGISGATTAEIASNASLQEIFDTNPKLIISLVGGNDPGEVGTVGTFSGIIDGEPIVQETDITQDYNGTYFIQAVSHIMRKVKAYYYDIRERANLTGDETEEEKTAKIDAVLKPYFVFCTPLPQQRTAAGSNWSNPANWERKANAVRECCLLYDIPCIDVLRLIDIDMSKEPFWTYPTDKLTNNGIYTMDGLHLNKFGFEVKLVPLLCGEIGIITDKFFN